MAKTILLEIMNFRKYNPRTDRAKHSWFRLENSVFSSEDLYGLSADQKWVWICLLCLASKKQTDIIEFRIDWLADTARLSQRLILETIDELIKKGLVLCQTPGGNQATPSGNHLETTGTTTLHYKQTLQTNTTAQFTLSDTDLDKLYAMYPRKIGKTLGFKKLRKELKSLADVEAFKEAIRRYEEELAKNNTDAKYIKHFSTFVNHWRESLDPEYGSANLKNSSEKKQQDVLNEIFGEESA